MIGVAFPRSHWRDASGTPRFDAGRHSGPAQSVQNSGGRGVSGGWTGAVGAGGWHWRSSVSGWHWRFASAGAGGIVRAPYAVDVTKRVPDRPSRRRPTGLAAAPPRPHWRNASGTPRFERPPRVERRVACSHRGRRVALAFRQCESGRCSPAPRTVTVADRPPGRSSRRRSPPPAAVPPLSHWRNASGTLAFLGP